MIGTIAYDELTVFNNFKSIFGLEGKRVLEIGGSLDFDYVIKENVDEWVSIDPVNSYYTSEKYKKIKGYGSKTDYPDNYFDYIFSCNAFEHINDLKETINEARRVLKPGGILYSHFGPIWSAPDGHHLDIEIEGRLTDFSTDYIIPHWMHILYTREESSNILLYKYNKDTTEEIVEAIYDSKWVNRLYFEDYVNIFNKSGLKIMKLETSETVDYPYVFPFYGIHEEEVKKRREEYLRNNNRNLYCRDILIVLSK